MSYRSLISKNVNTAFNSIGDLASSIDIVVESEKAFNFNSKEATSTESTLTVKAICNKQQKKSKDRNISVLKVMLKKDDVADIKSLEKIIFNNDTYKVDGSSISDNSFTITFEATRE